jgi:hypothetical protein
VNHDTPAALDRSIGSTTAWDPVVAFFYRHLDLGSLR